MNQTIKKSNYDLFHKKFMEETGKDAEATRQLMSKLKRAENQMHRVLDNKDKLRELQSCVTGLVAKYKSVVVKFNGNPEASLISFIFTKTGYVAWVNW